MPRLPVVRLAVAAALILPAALTAQDAMTNGLNYVGEIATAGEMHVYTFLAADGDAIMLAIGEVGENSALDPTLRVLNPDGLQVAMQAGNAAAHVEFLAGDTGIFTVEVTSADAVGTGEYSLTLAKAPGAFSISPGDQGGPMTNGSNHTGDIHLGDLDMWSFDAIAGDSLVIAIGQVGVATGFNPWIRLRSPTGENLGLATNLQAGQIDATATETGTYTLVVSTGDAGNDGSGSYTITLVKTPGGLTISSGDEGGPATNGSNHTGTIHVGDLDAWTFQATAGDALIVAVGEVDLGATFNPWIRLKDPTGQTVDSVTSARAAQIEVVAAVTGTFTVIVSSGDTDVEGSGDYTLTLAKTPGAFTISSGDEGGALTNGQTHTGAVHTGDLDMWSFQAGAGEAISVAIGESGPAGPFSPRIRLKSPTGQDLGSESGLLAAQINTTAAVAGVYTVVVSTGDAGFDGAGSYVLTIANTPRPFAVSAGDQGGPIAPGTPTAGAIHIGDLDLWTVFAHAGDPLTITLTDLNTPDTIFTPWVRLRGPTGAELGSDSGLNTATVALSAPASGVYTVVVGTADAGFDGAGDYELTVTGASGSMIRNGDFSNGETSWNVMATPTNGYIVHEVTNGVLQFFRVPPPAGTLNEALVFQETGVPLAAGAPVRAQFDLGNTSSVRKRITVIVLEADFSDLSVCTFWLEPGAPQRTYQMRTHTTQTWVNAALYFYAATAGEDAGRYEIDNVSMQPEAGQAADRTDCVDPTAPAAPGGPAGPELLANGNFDTGTLAPWFTFGTITSRITSGVFEFIRPSGTPPSGVVAQQTAETMPAAQILTATFRLGNSSGVRQRVTAIVHDSDFSDLSACTFWLAPGQDLSTYTYRTFTTKPWTNAGLSVYPATIGPAEWVRLDDATFQRTPGVSIVGTECGEPLAEAPASVKPAWRRGSAVDRGQAVPASSRRRADAVSGVLIDDDAARADVERRRLEPIDRRRASAASLPSASQRAHAAAISRAGLLDEEDAARGTGIEQRSFGAIDLRGASAASLIFESNRAIVQVSLDGLTWVSLDVVPLSEEWTTMQLDLSAYAGEVILVRVAGRFRRLEVVIR